MTYIMRRSNESHLILPVRPQVCGFFKLTAIRPDGRRRPLTDWFPNLITNGGLNRMGTDIFMRHCHVGSGTAAPTNTDTQLQTFIASTDTKQSTASGAEGSAPYYGWQRNTYRFATGAAEGNISEVGVGWASGSTGPLFSRALVVDGVGDPTTITVLSDEVLDVVYELRLIPPTADQSYNVVDDGPAGTTHAVVVRASTVTAGQNTVNGLGWGFGGTEGSTVALRTAVANAPRVYNGSLGAITASPSGTSDSVSGSNTAYDNNSLERVSSVFCDLGDGNLSGGISAMRVCYSSAGVWQVSFDPAIPKDSEKVLTIGFKAEWSRAT